VDHVITHESSSNAEDDSVKIRIQENASSGKVLIPSGEYWVALNASAGQITLMSQGKSVSLPSIKRKAKSRSKVVSVQFYPGGGRTWSLIVEAPNQGQWISMIEYDKDK
jgi:hypothetical protein